MAIKETPPVDVGTFYEVLTKLRDVRKWAVVNQGDPWAFRQAMITVMAIDTACALEADVDPRALEKFDMAAKEKAREFLESIPEEFKING